MAQYQPVDVTISDFNGHPTIEMPTLRAERYKHRYGKVRLSIMFECLPSVIAFIKSDGTTTDPATLSDEEVEMICQWLKESVSTARSISTE